MKPLVSSATVILSSVFVGIALLAPPGCGTARDAKPPEATDTNNQESCKAAGIETTPQVKKEPPGETVAQEKAVTTSRSQVTGMQQNSVGELIAAAIATAQLIQEPGEQAEAHTAIAEAQAKAGDVVGSRDSLDKAKAAAVRISDGFGKAIVYGMIAVAQTKAGDVTGARDSLSKAKATATTISDENAKAIVYWKLADMQVKSGDIAGAKATVAQISDENDKAFTYQNIAGTQATSGDFAGAKEMAAEISHKTYKALAYGEIIYAQVKCGDVAGAKATADEISSESREVAAAMAIEKAKAMRDRNRAETQAKAGDFLGAKATAAQISDESDKASVYEKIAGMQANSGDLSGAKVTLTEITGEDHRADAYREIVKAQAKTGDVTGAIEFVANAAGSQSRKCKTLAEAAEELCSVQFVHRTKAEGVASVTTPPSPSQQSQPALGPQLKSEGDGVPAFPITLDDVAKVIGVPNQKNGDSILYSLKMKVIKTQFGINILFSQGGEGLFYATGLFKSSLFTKEEGEGIINFVDEVGKSKSIGRFNVEVSVSRIPFGWRQISLTPASKK